MGKISQVETSNENWEIIKTKNFSQTEQSSTISEDNEGNEWTEYCPDDGHACLHINPVVSYGAGSNYSCELTWDKGADSEYIRRKKYQIFLKAVGKIDSDLVKK